MHANATATGPGRIRLLVYGAINVLVLALVYALAGSADPEYLQANTLLTMSLITNRALFVLENSLTAAGKINREYDDRFAVSGAKIGAYADVRKPPRFISQDGPDIVVQDVDESSVQIRIDKNKVVPFQFSNIDKVLSIDDYSERFLVPAISQLANDVDEEVCGIVNEIPYYIGTPGTIPSTSATYTKAHAILDYNAVPRNQSRTMVVTPDMEVNLVEALKGLFHQGEAISMQFKSNHMGHAFGWDFNMDQNCLTHEIGTWAGTDPLVDGADQTGASINSDGWGVAAMKKGDVIQIAGVYHINPKSPPQHRQAAAVRAHRGLGRGRRRHRAPHQPGHRGPGCQRQPSEGSDGVGAAGEQRRHHGLWSQVGSQWKTEPAGVWVPPRFRDVGHGRHAAPGRVAQGQPGQ